MGRLKSSADILGTQEIKTVGLWKALAAEFLGTLILVLFGCASTLGEKTDIVKVSLTFGFTLACLIQALDHISGCHVNPSVTLGMLVARYMSVTRSILYVVAQTLGGIAGAGILYGITPTEIQYGMGVSRVNPELSEGQAFGVEVLCTFLLVFTIFGTTDSRRTDVKGSISLAIGLAAVCTHLFGIPYTGASLNPARTFGPALVVGGDAWAHHWVYWAGPICGGILGALVYQTFFRGSHKPAPPPSDLPSSRALIPVTTKELKNMEMEA
ncbi:Major intrinsic protein [Trinorchestia longiramus]|nr:Major intrinsic protein [Trinorchestia longiramus]